MNSFPQRPKKMRYGIPEWLRNSSGTTIGTSRCDFLLGEVDISHAGVLADKNQDCGVGPGWTPKSCGSRSGPRWHCVISLGQQEHRALAEMLAQDFEAYLPLHLDRTPDRERIVPLFPRYLFAKFDPNWDRWRRICSTRGVYSMIWQSSERPAPLPVGVVENLIERTSARRVVDDPGQRPGVVYLAPGQRGRVQDGALSGMEGICTMSGSGRVKLLLSLFGGTREVEFKRELVVAA